MLNSKNLALSGGIIWGGSLCLLTLIAHFTAYGVEFLNLIASIYPKYDISLKGSFWALFWGFIDGFVALYLLAVIYNWFNNRHKQKQ